MPKKLIKYIDPKKPDDLNIVIANDIFHGLIRFDFGKTISHMTLTREVALKFAYTILQRIGAKKVLISFDDDEEGEANEQF